MDIAVLTKKVFEFCLPVLKGEAAKKIGKEVKEAVNNEAIILWNKVKSVFIEKIQDPEIIKMLEANPSDAETHGVIKHELKKELQSNESLKNELIELVKKAEAAQPMHAQTGSVHVEGDYNDVVLNNQGSTITINRGSDKPK